MVEIVKALMSEIFVCSVDQISESTMRADLDNWDSLQHMIFVSRLETEFKVEFSPEEINDIDSYTQVIEQLNRKLNN